MAITVGIKRLSQIVKDAGIQAFTRDDFYLVCNGVAQDPARLVLVGGQAIEVWGVLLDVPAPTGDQNLLTEDTDWLGSAADAQWLANFLQCENAIELTKATLDDNTANTAVLLLQRPDGRILLMESCFRCGYYTHCIACKVAWPTFKSTQKSGLVMARCKRSGRSTSCEPICIKPPCTIPAMRSPRLVVSWLRFLPVIQRSTVTRTTVLNHYKPSRPMSWWQQATSSCNWNGHTCSSALR